MNKLGFRLIAVSVAIAACGLSSAQAGGLTPSPAVAGKTYSMTFKSNKARSFGSIIKTASPVYGERCVTKIGSCTILPQPVGSPCQCGKIKGTTLQ